MRNSETVSNLVFLGMKSNGKPKKDQASWTEKGNHRDIFFNTNYRNGMTYHNLSVLCIKEDEVCNVLRK